MKDPEFYQASFDDSAFRRKKLEELRYLNKVGYGFIAFLCLCFVAHTVYAVLKDGAWDSGVGWLLALAITGGTVSVSATRIAALEEIEKRSSRIPN